MVTKVLNAKCAKPPVLRGFHMNSRSSMQSRRRDFNCGNCLKFYSFYDFTKTLLILHRAYISLFCVLCSFYIIMIFSTSCSSQSWLNDLHFYSKWCIHGGMIHILLHLKSSFQIPYCISSFIIHLAILFKI